MAQGTPGFFDVDERLAELSAKGCGDDLGRVKALIDFELFRAALETAVPPASPSKCSSISAFKTRSARAFLAPQKGHPHRKPLADRCQPAAQSARFS
jgi:hypothetical protein